MLRSVMSEEYAQTVRVENDCVLIDSLKEEKLNRCIGYQQCTRWQSVETW